MEAIYAKRFLDKGDIDSEHTFTSDSVLNYDEFVLQTETVVNFDPDTLNLGSKGRWITAYIECQRALMLQT